MSTYEELLPDWALPLTQFQLLTYHKDRSSTVLVWRLSPEQGEMVQRLLGKPDAEAFIDAEYAAKGFEVGSPGMTYMSREKP